jgi:RNA polymerase-interacting CarD/CdnL/TRCF family regulator
MPSLSHIKHQARALQVNASGDVKKLAQLVHDLARECEDIEKTAKEAADDARRAKRP